MARSLNLYLPEVEGLENGGVTADGLDDDIGEGDFVAIPKLGVFLIVHMDGDDAVLMYSAYFRRETEYT